MGYKEPVDAQLAAVGPEMFIAFPALLTSSTTARKRYEARIGGEKNRAADIHGYIRSERASVDDRDLCDRSAHPDCIGFVFDDTFANDLQAQDRIAHWLANLCVTLPVTIDVETSLYDSVAIRQRGVDQLRRYLACDSSQHRPVQVNLYVVDDFDHFFVNWPKRDPALRDKARLFISVVVR